MSDCDFKQNDAGDWTCQECGCTRAEQTKRNCLGKRQGRARVWGKLDAIDLSEEERAKITKRLNVCFGGCEKMLGGVCTDWPRPCKRFEVWMTRLIFGSCKEWEK